MPEEVKPVDVEKEAKEVEEVEELGDVELGLSDKYLLDIIAQERLNIVVAAKRLSVRIQTGRLSARANESVGAKEYAEKYKKQADEMEVDFKHCLRGLKDLDKRYPGALARMQELIKIGEAARG